MYKKKRVEKEGKKESRSGKRIRKRECVFVFVYVCVWLECEGEPTKPPHLALHTRGQLENFLAP